jgi:oligopeptide/dipeptide ABC transporter ATP-binding protein
MNQHGAAVRVSDLEVRFVSKRLMGPTVEARAVDGVSFEVIPGEVFCIAGESGSGKTTLGRTLLGLNKLHAGDVEIAGAHPAQLSGRALRDFRRTAQMIFQDPMGSLNPRQTVYEAVAEPVRIHNLPGNELDIVAAALSRVGLRPPERYFFRYPHELSGGQRQRVVIASGLVLRPSIVVADEPVSMLDALITHDLGFAWAIADRVAIMYLGKIVEMGPAEEVLTDPLHPYTKALLSVSPEVGRRSTFQILAGEPPDPTKIPSGCRFHPRCPVVASGGAGDLEGATRTEVPALVELRPDHLVACHVATAAEGRMPSVYQRSP